MSGHSKWSNIKRKKEINDVKRGKIFSKMSRLITVAAKQGGGDVDANATLRLAVEKAKEARMPKENIDRAIAKGTGGGSGTTFEEVIYEGFGPGGVAYMIEALTDNNNRTVAEIKTIFGKHLGSLGTPGCTSYIFDHVTKDPMFTVKVTESDSIYEQNEKISDLLEDHDDVQEIYSNMEL